jgi:hypothetical protein
LPRPSKALDLSPRKSRIRGIALVAQRHGDADGHALADLELRDRLARAAQVRLLAGDRRELLGGVVQDLGIGLGVAEAHVQRDLLDLGRLHVRGVAEALHQLRADLLDVSGLETCHD